MNLVTCVSKTRRSAPEERIRGIGGRNAEGKHFWVTQEQAIENIKAERWQFYLESGTYRIKLVVATAPSGRSYLSTALDEASQSVLLALPECEHE